MARLPGHDLNPSVEFIKIVVLCVTAAVLYGIVHDQFTARICTEYFTIFHPPVFTTNSPTLLAFGWGIIATWWAGAMIGLPLAIAAQAGTRSRMSAGQLVPYIVRLLLFMALCAIAFGCIGYWWGHMPEGMSNILPASMERRLLADLWAHSASYASGFLGGMVLCVLVWKRRGVMP
jgi:hypothetical protein